VVDDLPICSPNFACETIEMMQGLASLPLKMFAFGQTGEISGRGHSLIVGKY
jgi:hypothetical protein